MMHHGVFGHAVVVDDDVDVMSYHFVCVDKVPAKPEQNRTIWSVFASVFRAKDRRYWTVTL
jgi:hypothetical protein